MKFIQKRNKPTDCSWPQAVGGCAGMNDQSKVKVETNLFMMMLFLSITR